VTEFLKQIKISDFGRVVTGGTPATSDSEMWGEGYQFVTPTEMDGRGMFPSAGRVVTEKARSALRTRFCPADSIAVCCIGATIGKVVILPGTSLTNQQINSIVVDETQHDFRFVYYLMRTQTARLQAVASGSATPLLNKSVFESLSVSVPLLSDQRAIARVLGALDDKIDSNRKLASTLREYGQALLSQVMLLNSTITPLRSVVASVARGVAPSYVVDGDSALVLNQRCIRNGRVELSAARRMTHRTVTPERLAQHGDVLVNSTGTGTLGRVARWNGNTVFVDGHVSVVKPDAEKFPPTVLAYLLLLCQPEIEELAEGSTGQTELSPKRLLDFQLALPKVVDAEKVEPELRDLELRGEKAIQESDALESLRDALLPELLSGRLRVEDAESIMVCAG
jgi:type I restriction enzyme S subunit